MRHPIGRRPSPADRRRLARRLRGRVRRPARTERGREDDAAQDPRDPHHARPRHRDHRGARCRHGGAERSPDHCAGAGERTEPVLAAVGARKPRAVRGAVAASSCGDVPRRVDEALDVVGLSDAGRKMVGQFSAGMMQRLLVARALLGSPRVLLLDEPTRSLDPTAAHAFRAFLREELGTRRGCAVLVATHRTEEAFELCDRVVVLNRGRVVAAGPSERARRVAHGLSVLGVHARAEPPRARRSRGVRPARAESPRRPRATGGGGGSRSRSMGAMRPRASCWRGSSKRGCRSRGSSAWYRRSVS